MKIICTTERKIEVEETCKKEYCCKEIEAAMNYKERDSTGWDRGLSSTFKMTNTGIKIETHNNCRGNSHKEKINFCPWCGKPITLEKIKIDNTGLPPKESKPVIKKKKHWRNL